MQKKISNQPTCLDDVYKGTLYKYTWRCAKGHKWKATWDSILRGTGCPYCFGNKGTTIETLQEFAKSKNGKCLSTEYINTKTKYEWRCNKNHVWHASWNSVKSKCSWCPYCSGRKGITIEILQETAEFNGGQCLSSEYINAHKKYEWQCDKEHKWETSWNEVQQGKWCPYCSGRKGTTIEALQEFAKSKNGKCLSLDYINSYTDYEWQCNKNHVWHASWDNVKRGTWCRKCYYVNKIPKFSLKEIDELIFKFFKQNGKRPTIKNSKKLNSSLRRNYNTSLSKRCDFLNLPKLVKS